MPREKKAAIYCRVSTMHQVDKDSLPMQRNDMINYARYALGITEYEVFEDAGYSGKNTDRPAFQTMMERIKAGEFTHVLVWKIDRISRNLLDFATMYASCKKLGVTFVSKNEQFDTSTAMGEAMLKIILVFAELERNMTSERVSATMNARAAEGKWNGGRVPFGYTYDRETDSFAFRDDEASVAIELKDIYLQEHSLTKTAKLLNEAGRRTRRGYKWTPATVAIILRSPFYRGTYRYNYRNESEVTFSFRDKSQWVMCGKHHPALFSADDYERLDYWLTKNQRVKGKAHHVQRKHVHIFAGLIYCGSCGEIYFASADRPSPSGYQRSMYLCSGRRKSRTCRNKYVTDDGVGSFIFSYISHIVQLRTAFRPNWSTKRIQKFLLKGRALQEVESIPSYTLAQLRIVLLENVAGTAEYQAANERTETASAAAECRRANLEAELERSKRALDRLTHLFLYAEDAMPQTEYLQQKKVLDDNITRIRSELAKIKKSSIFASSLSDEQFISKAAGFLFKTAVSSGRIDFPALVNDVGRPALKEFVNTVITRITVLDGHVTQIEFTNGQVHTFRYKP